ncbi:MULTISPECIES: hypothetical protein [unclassified Micromonospora]|uniref:hypothetical protein n=1 Tax=unclassified Micromonospora TaxID=2617518 RepID=UPI001C5F388F|nr:hypothetical protein [Micromonospora sp. RL09-050-HVF-A]MBW4706026.1 hypothetical protein [Micromonospora sp. RL09-050-HVF-A]
MSERPWPGRLLITLLALVPVTACGPTPVAPLPVRSATPTVAPATPTAPTAPATAVPTSAGPVVSAVSAPSARHTPSPPRRTPTAGTRPPSTSPRPQACLGPVRYDLVVSDTELALLKSLCLSVGGVLRIQGIGPGEVEVDREDLVSSHYEAGVVDIRFVHSGTVQVTIPQGGKTYPVTVVVV